MYLTDARGKELEFNTWYKVLNTTFLQNTRLVDKIKVMKIDDYDQKVVCDASCNGENYNSLVYNLTTFEQFNLLPYELLDTNENKRLRTLLALCYAGHELYGDDGELQDNRQQPFIDFKRDSIDEIEAKMKQRGQDTVREALQGLEKEKRELWKDVWIESIGSVNCPDNELPRIIADRAVKDFEERFDPLAKLKESKEE